MTDQTAPTLTPDELTELVDWLGKQTWSDFAQDLAEYYATHRTLSQKQLTAALSMRAKMGSRKPSTPTDLDLSALPPGRYAVPNGDTRLRLRIDRPDEGKYAGWTFVTDGSVYGEGARYGSQRPGATYRGELAAELALVVADPLAAAAAYGKLTGQCAICNRTLEDEQSIERGIGPTCLGKLSR